MLPVVEQLDVEDMIAAAAYAASLEPDPTAEPWCR
jgi:hypothetical protein